MPQTPKAKELLTSYYVDGIRGNTALNTFFQQLSDLPNQDKISLLSEVFKVSEERSFYYEATFHKFFQLAEESQDIIWLANRQGELLYLNPVARKELGIPANIEDETLTVADFREESLEKIVSIIKVIEEKGTIVQEAQLKHFTEDCWIDIEANSFVVKDEQGNFVCIASICRDITKRKKSEQALRESYEELQTIEEELRQNSEELAATNDFLYTQQQKLEQYFHLIENSQDMIALINLDTSFIYCNNAFRDKVKLTKDQDITSYKLQDFRAEENIEELTQTIRKKILEQGVSRHIAKFKCVNSQHFFEAETTGFPIYLPDTKELYCIGFIARDISEVRLAERKLKLQQESFNSMTGVVPSMIYQFRQFTNGDATFLYTSKGVEGLFEKRVGYFYDANNFLEMIFEDDKPDFTYTMSAAIDSHNDFNWEGRIRLDSGKVKWLSAEARFERVIEEDQSVVYSGVFSDVTERKKAEELLMEQREELLMKNEKIALQRDQIEEQRNKIDGQKRTQKRYNDVILSLTKSVEIQEGLWEQALEIITKKSALTLGISQVSVWLYGDEKLTCSKMYDASLHNFREAPILGKEKYPQYFERLEAGEEIIAKNIFNSLAYVEFSEARLASSLLQSIVEIPFFAGTDLVGVLKFGQLHQQIDWSAEDLTFMNSISDLIKIAREAHQRVLAEAKVKAQKRQLELKNTIIAKKNDDITASLNYASRIQSAILPHPNTLEKGFSEHFILYQPKEIVSGDFYWYDEKVGKQIIAAVDCTGHGVPGAFMSMLGNQLLDKIINIDFVFEADQILNFLHLEVQKVLKQKDTGNQDGMDIALCVIDRKAKTLDFAGAHNPLVYIQDGEIQVIKGDRLAIGGDDRGRTKPFTKHQVDLTKPTTFYLYSDGYQDQFGGIKNKKFTSKRFRELLFEQYQLSMFDQKENLTVRLKKWMEEGGEEQVDDILIMGFHIA